MILPTSLKNKGLSPFERNSRLIFTTVLEFVGKSKIFLPESGMINSAFFFFTISLEAAGREIGFDKDTKFEIVVFSTANSPVYR